MEERQLRSIPTTFETREDGDSLIIDAYFAVYNSNYEIAQDMSESIAPGVFQKSLGNDIRALINHDTTLVLGRTAAHTLELRDDSHGLFGSIVINRNDSDAMNAYARVKRGDVSQCSIGFNIVKEDTEVRDDGSVHWTIREANLIECSLCTFPAYEATSASARAKERDEVRRREFTAWKERATKKLKGEKDNGAEGISSAEED